MDQNANLSEETTNERVRQAVIKAGGRVTVADISSSTGLGVFEAERSLKALLATHEGVLKVSEFGELIFAFSPGCIARDHRSWWARSKENVYRGFKFLFKITIMVTLVFYFVV